MLLQSNSFQSKKQTARHPFRNTSETAKHHLISCPKRSKGTPKKGLTSLLKPYLKLQLCRCLPLPAAACCCLLLPLLVSAGVCWCLLCRCLLLPLLVSAAACCCLLLPAAACGCLRLPACCSLLLPAAAGGCCCCCCGAAVVLLQSNSLQSKKQTARHPFRNTSETAKHNLISYPKRSKGTPKKGLTSLLKPYLKLQLCRCLPLPAAASAGVCCCLLLPAAACCCLLLVLLLVAAAAAVVLLQSNSLQSKKQTARHPFRNTSETAKHHLISCPKRSKGTPKKGLTSLLKPYYKIATLPLPAAACCCLLLPAAASAGVCCCLLLPAAAMHSYMADPQEFRLLPAAGAAAAVVLLQSNSLQSKKQTARHPFRNTSETAKHHLISCPKRSKGTPKLGLTSLLKPYYKIATLPLPAVACCCLLLPAAASAGVCWCLLCRCLLLPLLVSAAACCCLLLPAAACGCLRLPACCSLLLVLLLVAAAAAAAVVLLWCCCNQTASKARNKQPDTLFETHPKQQNTT